MVWDCLLDRRKCKLSTDVSERRCKKLLGDYLAAHQHFFQAMCVAGKVEEAVELTKKASIGRKKSVIICLQKSGGSIISITASNENNHKLPSPLEEELKRASESTHITATRNFAISLDAHPSQLMFVVLPFAFVTLDLVPP